MGHDHVHAGTNEISRKLGKPFVFSLRPAVIDDDVRTLDVTEVVQPQVESLYLARVGGRRRGPQKPNLRDLLLRARRERPRRRRATE